MPVSGSWGVLFLGVPIRRALLLGVLFRATVFWKVPYGDAKETASKQVRLRGM